MLLSHIYNTNNRVMDDFTDQDWFEESVDITNKNSAEQQSPDNVPTDLADLSLVLDVPLDETIFFSGGEHNPTQSQEQYFNQSAQRSSIEQNHEGEGSSSVELCGKQLLDLDLSNQHQVYNSTQTSKHLEFVEGKSQYLNCPPTTSLTTLQSYPVQKPIHKHPPKSWTNNQRQNLSHQKQNYHQLNSANANTMQFITIPNDDPLYHNGGHRHLQSNNNTMVHQIEPTVNLPSNCLNDHPNHSHEFYADFHHHPGQQSKSFCMQVEAGPSSNFVPSSEQILHSTHNITNYQNYHPNQQLSTSNNGSAKVVVAKKSKPKKKALVSNNLITQQNSQPQQNNQQQKNVQLNVNESSGLDKVFSNLFTNQQTATLKFNDPKLASEFAMLMAHCSQLTEQQRMGMDVNAEIKETEANIAACIMRNTTTICSTNTFNSNCANHNSILNTHHQNNQNQQQSKLKRNRPKKKPPKISSMPQLPTSFTQLPPTTAMSRFGDSLSQMLPSQNNEDLITSQHQPITIMDQQILPPADGISLIMANEDGIMPQPCGSDNRQQFLVPIGSESDTICQRNGWAVGNSTHDNYIKIASTSTTQIFPISQQINSTSSTPLHNRNSKLLNQTKQHHFIVHQQSQLLKVKQQKEQLVSVLLPANISPQYLLGSSNHKLSAAKHPTQTIYTRKQIRVVTKESAEELQKRLEKEKVRRQQRVTDYFKEMYKQIQSHDYKTKFTGENDCIKKLLPFALYMEPELSQDFMDKFDEQLQRHSKLMQERQQSVERRLQSLLLRETMGKMDEERNLLLFLDAQYEKEALNKEILDIVPTFSNYHFELLEGISTINRMSEWEYNGDWDEAIYLNITSFSPSPEPEIKHYDKDGQQQSLIEHEKIVEMHKELDVELLQRDVGNYAKVKVQLHPYYKDTEKIIKTEEENKIGSKRTCSSPMQEKIFEQLEENRNIFTNKSSPEILKFIPDSIPNENISSVQQFSFENLVKEMIMPTQSSLLSEIESKSQEMIISKLTNSSIIPTVEKGVAMTEGMERIDKECMDKLKEIKISQKNRTSKNNDDSEKKSLEKSPTPIPTVKLTIKLGSGNKKEEILNKPVETAEEKKLRKKMKKVRKAEKKAKKSAEKEKKRKELEKHQKNMIEMVYPNEIASSSQHHSLVGIPPLKISLKKSSNLANGQAAIGPENALSGTVEESLSAAILTSGSLKLRISKKLPLERRENEDKGNNEEQKNALLILQNGLKEEGKKERKKNKKIDKKRKREAEIEGGNEEEPVEKKVPKIKIKFAGEMVTTTTFGRQPMEPQEETDQKNYNQIEGIKQQSPRQTNQLMTTDTNRPTNNYTPLSQSLALEESIPDKERKRIQFSPCSSDNESDTDLLRQRTANLLSKIGRLQ